MSELVHDIQRLKELQALPLDRKILITQARIIEWYNHFEGNVYVSFSGGKDSTVLLHLARRLYPELPAMFVDTGLEYPEVRQFVKTFNNVDIVRPKLRFDKVIKRYGYPVISKEVSNKIYYARKGSQWATNYLNGKDSKGVDNSYYNTHYAHWKWLLNSDFPISDQCCNAMKKSPAHSYSNRTGRKSIVATLACESSMRQQMWVKDGCNGFNLKIPVSKPMSFWTEQDVLEYINKYQIPIASVYGEVIKDESGRYKTTGVDRTGCVFCAYGAHREKSPNRFEKLRETHPKQYGYCINGGEYVDGIWLPSKEGLGLGRVLDFLGIKY